MMQESIFLSIYMLCHNISVNCFPSWIISFHLAWKEMFWQKSCNTIQKVDDVIETANHFRCIDLIIESAKAALTEKLIKELHLILKNGTADSRKEWFVVGDYKKQPNEVGGMETTLPEESFPA